jgi:hypothetical protein
MLTTFSDSTRYGSGISPLFGFVSNQLSEIRGRAREHRAAKITKARLDFRFGECSVDLFV